MVQSQKKQQEIYLARKDQQKQRKNAIRKLTQKQYGGLLKKFYRYAEEFAFYLRLGDALENNGFFFLDPQRQIAEAILEGVFMKKSRTINISITRQFGKTELVTLVMSFVYDEYYKVFKEPFTCCVVAPEKGTASSVFKRLENYIVARAPRMAVDRNDYKETIRGDSVGLVGIHEDTKGSTAEGRTYHCVVRDECHLGDDQKYIDQVIPTTFRKDAVIINIGNGGFRKCYYLDRIVQGNIHDNFVFRFDYTSLKPYMENLADQGLYSAKIWCRNIEKYIRDHGGIESYDVMKNVFCKWITSFGNFLTEKEMMLCHDDTIISGDKEKKTRLYLAVDFASVGDRTIATFLNADRKIEDWLVVKDSNQHMTLREQCEIVRDYSDDNGYTERLNAIGGDSTGLGIGAIEFLSTEFGCQIVNYSFSAKKKHDWYINMRDLMMTKNDKDRIWYNPSHRHAGMFEQEMLEMEVEVLKNGYLGFHAPNKPNKYDDFPASLAMANDMRLRELQMYVGLKSRSERMQKHYDKKKAKKKGGKPIDRYLPAYYAPAHNTPSILKQRVK